MNTAIDNDLDKIPSFLNVLTILTFIGSGLAALMGVYNLLTVEKQARDLEEARILLEQTNGFFGADIIEQAIAMQEHAYLLQGTAFLVAIACLFAAFMMRKLQKNGFYLYLVASIASVAIPLSVVGTSMLGVIIIFGSIFTIAFVIMYGVNLKYMK